VRIDAWRGRGPGSGSAAPGASAAYLTVSEIFPMETRAMAIAFFYATGTIVGGFGGPLLFGALIQSGEPGQIFIGYVVGAAVMIVGGIIQALMGVEAAGRDLEDIAPPLSAAGDELEDPGEATDPYTLAPEEGRSPPAAEGRFQREGAPAADREGPASTRPPGGQ
jgi:MFS family permease